MRMGQSFHGAGLQCKGMNRLALSLAVVLLYTPPALLAQGAAPASPPQGFLGYTFCRNGLAESWVRADIIGTPQAEEILAHEQVHRAQAALFPSCEAWVASLGSARKVIEAEIPAYCAQWHIVVLRGVDADSLRREYSLRISAQAGGMENRLDVLEMFRRDCT
jgi:hypothetical protein